MNRTTVGEIGLAAGPAEKIATDLLALGVTSIQGVTDAIAGLDELLGGQLRAEIERRGFTGRIGSSLLLPTYGTMAARNLLLMGMGEAATVQSWRLLGEAAWQNAGAIRARTIAISASARTPACCQAIAEGLDLAAYSFSRYKGTAPTLEEREATIITSGPAEYRQALEAGRRAAAATNFARDLINTPAEDASPEFLADAAAEVARRNQLSFQAHDRQAIKRLRMGGLLGVSQASAREPRFIELGYAPPGTTAHIALVGKGITFDSGGLDLKSAAAMEEQKRDMTGAAVMLGVMSEIAHFRPALGVRAYLPCSENMIGPGATKPGDVLRMRSGKTVEVMNTDAEGRLVLADALSYACDAGPRSVIDAGTLTAAVRIALGTRVGAVMSTDPALAGDLRQAATSAGERLWELPLVAEYADELRSNVADLRNVGTSGSAGTIICGLFLKEFVSCPSWAHLDLSGVAFSKTAGPLAPAGATGFGVRTLLRYLGGTREAVEL